MRRRLQSRELFQAAGEIDDLAGGAATTRVFGKKSQASRRKASQSLRQASGVRRRRSLGFVLGFIARECAKIQCKGLGAWRDAAPAPVLCATQPGERPCVETEKVSDLPDVAYAVLIQEPRRDPDRRDRTRRPHRDRFGHIALRRIGM
ncbi:MAG: hypothetical protein EA385_03650 [Salinarimonadaceae bacterium]|nr:MAG: hypothetical protein EA385_03650 [Salinarimonadaceae bacterium]